MSRGSVALSISRIHCTALVDSCPMKAMSLNAQSSNAASSPVNIGGLPSFSGSILCCPLGPARAVCAAVSSCLKVSILQSPLLGFAALSRASEFQLSAGPTKQLLLSVGFPDLSVCLLLGWSSTNLSVILSVCLRADLCSVACSVDQLSTFQLYVLGGSSTNLSVAIFSLMLKKAAVRIVTNMGL
eukprot:6461236-Amphidinium_carterae.2